MKDILKGKKDVSGQLEKNVNRMIYLFMVLGGLILAALLFQGVY